MRTAASLVSAIVFALIPTVAFTTGSGNCLDFDGVDDYAVGSGFSTSLTNLTLEAWVYHRTVPASIQRYVYLQGSGSNDVAGIRHDGAAQQGRLHFYISTGGGYRHIQVDGALQAGKWRHIVGTWDGTTQRLYLDGEEVGTNTPGGSLDAGDGYVILSNQAETMDGYLDEVRIWNDTRTPDEIRSNMYRSLTGSETGLESYWKLDETSGSTAYDDAGSVDLTLYIMTNDDWVTSGAFSGPRNALVFDGSNDYVSIPSSPSLDNSQFTTEFWVRTPSPGNWEGIIDKGRSTNSDWCFLTGNPGSEQGIMFGIGTGGSVPTVNYSWNDALWHHVAGTYDGTTARLYVDGVEKGSRTVSMSVTTNNITIGSRRNQGWPFAGIVDEVRIWDDVRTPEEIREYMCKTMVGDESNLVGYWRFDQEEATTLYDWSSNGNDGALTNMADNDWVACNAFTTWIGCAGTDWATAANWSLGAVPNSTSTNVGIPSYTGGNQPTMANDYTCNHLSITSEAMCTISSPWTLTLNGNAYSIGSMAGAGEVDLTGASAAHALSGTFNNVELNESSGAELAGDAVFDGILTLTNGMFTVGANTLTLKNALGGTVTNLSADSTSSIIIAGSGIGVNIPGHVTELNNVTLNNTNGAILQSDLALDGVLTLTDGAFSIATNTLTLNGLISAGSGGLTGGSFSNIMFGGTGASTNLPVVSLNDLTINRSNGIGLAGDVTVDGALTLTSGAFTLGANTLTLKNAIVGTATNLSADNTSSIAIVGSGTGVNIPGHVTELNNVTLDNINGTTLQNGLELDGVLTLTDGALSIAANTLTLNGSISVGSGGLTGGSSSNIMFGGTSASTDLPTVSLNDLTINRPNGIGLAGGVTIGGTVTLTNGDVGLNGHTLTLGATATLSETDGNTVQGDSGAVTTTRTFNAGDLSGGGEYRRNWRGDNYRR